MSEGAIRVAILTLSDRAAQGLYADRSGPALRALVQEALQADVVEERLLPDEREVIAAQLRAWADGGDIDLILTTGGTGFGPRDLTPEATADVIEREAPGLAEAMRAASLRTTPHAMLSRARCGIRKATLIVNLPGSVRGATENLRVILSALPHAVELLRGQPQGTDGHA